MDTIKVGCGQLTWDRSVPEAQVLAEIAQAGYDGAPASARGGRSAEETMALYAEHGLEAAPGYFGASFWIADKAEEIAVQASEVARFMAAVGCSELYVAASPLTRREAAGHVRAEDAMSDDALRQFARTLNRAGMITLEQGVRSCFHNHVGSGIETREEIDRLFSMVDPEVVFQGPDIGHLAWAGADPVQFCRDYASLIKSVHVKDIDPIVMREGIERSWDYGTFSDHGIFAELGEGCVDFPATLAVLRSAGFEGWVIVETDVTQKATALESAAISRSYLSSIGL